MPGKSPASIAGRGTLRVTIGSTVIELPTDDFERHAASPILPLVQNTGDIDYTTLNPQEGITHSWDDFSGGAGAYVDEPGRYGVAVGLDCRRAGVIIPGPKEVADKTGIAANERVIGHILVGTVNWIITNGTANGLVYEDSTGSWVDKTGGAGWVAGTPTCIVEIGGDIAIGMGNAQAWNYTIDGGANWVVSTNAGNSKYMDRAVRADNAGTASKVWYFVNPNLLYNVVSLRNGATITTSSTVGNNLNDNCNCMLETRAGVLVMFKRSNIYSIDSAGLVRNIGGQYYRHIATSDSGATTKPNFSDSFEMHGRVYFRAEDYHLYEIDFTQDPAPINRIDPALSGPQIARMQLPITAMCRIGNEVWIAMGSANSATIKDITRLPGGAQLLINNLPVTSELWVGRRKSNEEWIWHGSLMPATNIIAFMWLDDATSLLYMASATAELINVSQTRAFIAPDDPLSTTNSGSVQLNLLSSSIGQLETGLFTQRQPNITKTARRVTLRSRGLASAEPYIQVRYRTTEDDDAATPYTILAKYTSPSTGRTGTAFPANTTFKGIRFILDFAGASPSSYPVFYNFQLIYLHFPPIQDVISFSFDASKAKVMSTGARSTESMHSLRTAMMTTWKDTAEPATVLDVETGESWAMRLEHNYPREIGLGKQRKYLVVGHEVTS